MTAAFDPDRMLLGCPIKFGGGGEPLQV